MKASSQAGRLVCVRAYNIYIFVCLSGSAPSWLEESEPSGNVTLSSLFFFLSFLNLKLPWKRYQRVLKWAWISSSATRWLKLLFRDKTTTKRGYAGKRGSRLWCSGRLLIRNANKFNTAAVPTSYLLHGLLSISRPLLYVCIYVYYILLIDKLLIQQRTCIALPNHNVGSRCDVIFEVSRPSAWRQLLRRILILINAAGLLLLAASPSSFNKVASSVVDLLFVRILRIPEQQQQPDRRY